MAIIRIMDMIMDMDCSRTPNFLLERPVPGTGRRRLRNYGRLVGHLASMWASRIAGAVGKSPRDTSNAATVARAMAIAEATGFSIPHWAQAHAELLEIGQVAVQFAMLIEPLDGEPGSPKAVLNALLADKRFNTGHVQTLASFFRLMRPAEGEATIPVHHVHELQRHLENLPPRVAETRQRLRAI